MSEVNQQSAAPGCATVIVTYHTGPCLMECIEAILGEHSAREVVVVDNGNPADVVADLHRRAEAEPRLSLLTGHGNVGFGRACNMGAAITSAPYILLLNPDNVVKPGALDGAVATLAKHPEAGLYTISIENPDGSEQRGCRRNLMTPWTCLVEIAGLWRLGCKRINLHDTPPPEALTEVECISGSFLLFPRVVYERIGGMDEDYFLHMEDVDVCLRVRKSGGAILFDPAFAATHVQGTSEVTKLFIERQKTISGTLYFTKHFGGWANPLVALLNAALWARYGLIAVRLALTGRG